MTTVELFLIAMLVVFAGPYLIWRLGRTDYWAPLVVIQIFTGIFLGPGILGTLSPETYKFVFTPQVITALNGIAWWAVSLFVFFAGLELDLSKLKNNKTESAITAGLAMGTPLLFGSVMAWVLITYFPGTWIGSQAQTWQFILGIGMACAVTALPILILLMQKLNIFRQPIGQRILRYASLDDIAIWGVLALILLDWNRLGQQGIFLTIWLVAGIGMRKLMPRLPKQDRIYVALIWLIVVALGADWCGLHFMVGAFLAGMMLDRHWFDGQVIDFMREHVLLFIMPVFFLSTGLRTSWELSGLLVIGVALLMYVAQASGKILGIQLAGNILKWPPGEARLVGWLLQTKALIEIIFVSVLLDKGIITSQMFTVMLLMALISTMSTVPAVTPLLKRLPHLIKKH
jgi:Kef-type K+ transport system membrane component KefB